jgi:hypothetical protein
MGFKVQAAVHALADTGMGEQSIASTLAADGLARPSAVLACAKLENPHVAPIRLQQSQPIRPISRLRLGPADSVFIRKTDFTLWRL